MDIPLTEGTKSELTLSRVGRKDSALYTCVATNKYGSDDTNIQLIVQGEYFKVLLCIRSFTPENFIFVPHSKFAFLNNHGLPLLSSSTTAQEP